MRKKRKIDENVMTGRKIVQNLIDEVAALPLGPKTIAEYSCLVRKQAKSMTPVSFQLKVDAQKILSNYGKLGGEIG